MQTQRINVSRRERIIRGKNNWWFLGPGGTARLYADHLTAEGTLTPAAEDRLRESGLFTVKQPNTYTLTVLTSTACNLGCNYCFQNTGQDVAGGSRPPRIAHARLNSEMITDVLEFAGRQKSAVGVEKLHILLFGGEPLLNPRGCLELLARAADYGLVSASMISNATLLTPRLAGRLVDLGLRLVQVTFDGDRTHHDLTRVRRSGGGTFDSIVDNMAAVSKAVPIRWAIRVHVSHQNHTGVDALIDRLADRLDTSACSLSLARVDDVGIGYLNEMRHDTLLAERFFQWQKHALERGFQVDRPTASFLCLTCSFVNGPYGAVVNADGSLASCWETAGKPGWEVGSVADGYLPSDQLDGRWISCEDNHHFVDGRPAKRVFEDTLDAAFLDYLDGTGRL